jgi:hypothetical protein
MEPKKAVLERKIDYVKIGINGKLELVCAHKYGYYERVMTQLGTRRHFNYLDPIMLYRFANTGVRPCYQN